MMKKEVGELKKLKETKEKMVKEETKEPSGNVSNCI